MAYRDKERARQALKRGRQKERLRLVHQDATMTSRQRDIGHRLAEQFMRARAKTVSDMNDLRQNTLSMATNAMSDWRREHGESVASYACRRVSISRVEELYREHYASTRSWRSPRNPPSGKPHEAITINWFIAVMMPLFLAGIVPKMIR